MDVDSPEGAELPRRGLRSMPNLEKLIIPSNRLSDTGSVNILNNVSEKTVKQIDLSDNQVGRFTIKSLAEKLGRKEFML